MGITYRDAMKRIHAIRQDGTVLKDVEVFREAYNLVGLGWLYAPSSWPIIKPLVNYIYFVWAKLRLQLMGRSSLDELCRERCTLCDR